MRPRLLDLFCCQGGAGMGYHRAGFDVIGVDIEPQPKYPFRFVCCDALALARDRLNQCLHFKGYLGPCSGRPVAIHASPPCEGYSAVNRIRQLEYDTLIDEVREMLERIGLPYVIENVEGARRFMRDPQMLCGSMFGLRLYRHRLFETNWPYTPPLHGEHYLRNVKMGRPPADDEMLVPVGNFSGIPEAREAMGMPWADRAGLSEAIPPAYTEHIGRQLLEFVSEQAQYDTPCGAAMREHTAKSVASILRGEDG